MKVCNVSGVARAVTPASEEPFVVETGDVVEVPEPLGASLCAQPRNWQPVEETDDEGEE